MKFKMRHSKFAIIIVVVVLQACTANLLPKTVKKNDNPTELEKKGIALLDAVLKAQGFDHLNDKKVYEFVAEDHWKGPMSGMGKLWPEKRTRMRFKYIPNTFDASVEFLDGKKQGQLAGLQSWQYYERGNNADSAVFGVQRNKRYVFGMAAFQYFTELAQRLSNAPIVRYAGAEYFNGVNYELVYATWGSVEPNKEYDQYVLYINKSTNLIEYTSYTLRDNYLKMPGSGHFYGTVHFADIRDVAGFKVPFQQFVFLGKPKKKDKKYVHKLTLESFKFDGFEAAELRPNPDIEVLGDRK